MWSASNQGYARKITLVAGMLLANVALAEGEGPLSQFTPELSDEFRAMLHEAKPEDGELDFMRKCSSCHDQAESGGHGKGPHLWNLFGRQAGTAPGFNYSEAMKSSGHTWNLATLDYYLTDTERAVPGREMNFRGISRDVMRARLLRFLMQFNSTPPDLPE